MFRHKKNPILKANFKKISVMKKEEDIDDLENIREIVVEDKSGFNTVEVIIIIIVSIAFGFVIGSGVSFFRDEYQGIEISASLQEFISVYHNIIDTYYEDLDEQKLVDAAINGMLSSLDDPYSTYMDEENSDAFSESVDGSYTGIGITLLLNDDGEFVVLDVLEDSPAEKEDIQVGDIVVEIDGESLEGLSMGEVTSKIKDNSNSVRLTLRRGEEELNKKVTPDTVDLVSVTSDVYALNNGNAGYIAINNFAANTYKQFKKELKKIEKKNIKSLIIDVRSNPGGHVQQTRDILELFIEKGKVLYQVQFKDDGAVLGTQDVLYGSLINYPSIKYFQLLHIIHFVLMF